MSVIGEYRKALETGDEELIEDARRDMRVEALAEEYFNSCDIEEECENDEPYEEESDEATDN